MKTAVGYLRKSRSDDPTKEISEDVQRAAVERMAQRDGVQIATWYRDWDRSADESKSARRVDFNRMVRAIEAGEVGTVYALAADRLYRSIEAYIRLTTAAQKAGTRVITDREGIIGGDGSPLAEFQAGLGALLGKLELSTAKVRARAAYAAREARGDHVGQVPYGYTLVRVDGRLVLDPPGLEWVDDGNGRHLRRTSGQPPEAVRPILDAFVRAKGRVRTAVRIVNDELGIPSPYGGHWDRRPFLRVIEREAPHLLAPKGISGRRETGATPALFAKLLRCHCGATMTPNRHVERRRSRETVAVSYYCATGNAKPGEHGRPYYVSESALRPAIEAEAARLTPPAEVQVAEDSAARRAALVEKRRRIARSYNDGGIEEAEYVAETRKVRDALAALDTEAHVIPILRPVDWDAWTVEEVNAVLRSIFTVQLGRDLRPESFDWHYPAWRGEVAAVA